MKNSLGDWKLVRSRKRGVHPHRSIVTIVRTALLAMLAMVMLNAMASAQTTIDATTIQFYEFESRALQTGQGVEPDDVIREVAVDLDASMFSLSFDRSTSRAEADGNGSAFGNYRATLVASEVDGSYGGSMSAVVSSTVSAGGENVQLFSNNYARMAVQFEVSGGGAMMSITGLAQVTGLGTSTGTVDLRVAGPAFHSVANLSIGDGAMGLNEVLVLPAGAYTMSFDLDSSAGSLAKGVDNTVNCNLTFEFDITPAAEEIFWNTNDGEFDTAENWEPQQVPNLDNIAIFNRDASPYTVTLENPAVSRLIVDRGSVTFDGLTFMAAGGNAETPAVIIGDSAQEQVSLFLNVDDVSTFHTVVANDAGTMATLGLEGLAEYANEGPLVVGATGAGTLNIGETALINTESLVLGQFGGSTGTANVFGISENATQVTSGSTTIGRFAVGSLSAGNTRIETGETVIGQLPGSDGTATINQGGGEAVWEFDAALTVGDQGNGMLDAHDRTTLRESGAAATPVRVAGQTGSDGVLILRTTGSSLTTSGDVFVGPGGSGELDLLDGARLSASMMFVGPTFENDNPEADGSLTISGTGDAPEDAQVTLTGDLVVGDRGDGELLIANGTIVESDRGLIATENNGDALVTIQNATWRATSEIALGTTESEGLGSGTLRLLDGQVETDAFTCHNVSFIEGTGLIFAATSNVDCGLSPNSNIVTKGARPEIGTLQFDGDVNFNGATITIDAASPTNADMILVTGNADLVSTTIIFNFIEGYLPQTGDELPFIFADGTLTIDENTTLQYTGAAEGFEFDVNVEDGMLMFQAQTDAQPEGGGEGEGEGEGDGDTEGTGDGAGCAAGPGHTSQTALVDLLLLLVAIAVLGSVRRQSGRAANSSNASLN